MVPLMAFLIGIPLLVLGGTLAWVYMPSTALSPSGVVQQEPSPYPVPNDSPADPRRGHAVTAATQCRSRTASGGPAADAASQAHSHASGTDTHASGTDTDTSGATASCGARATT